MSVAILRGIVLSISIVTALGIAVLENPQVQQWLEEQRRKIAELLRSIGEELDPQSRRAAEAFAFQGRTSATDSGLRREAVGSREAVATATGTSVSNATSRSTIRRIPVQGPTSPKDAEERKRKGKEYLAQREQRLYELQQRRSLNPTDSASSPTPNASFDALVDEDGKLKEDRELQSPPLIEPVPTDVPQGVREVEHPLAQPVMVEQTEPSSYISGWQSGSRMANPFADEYAMDRSETPRPRPPTVPPKIALDPENEREIEIQPDSSTSVPAQSDDSQILQNLEGLSYEEQLAIALSLSEAQSAAGSSSHVRPDEDDEDDDDDLKAAIQASLKDRENAATSSTPLVEAHQDNLAVPATLIDLTYSPSAPQPRRPSNLEALFASSFRADHHVGPASPPPQQVEQQVEDEDDLYRITPRLTKARLASLEGNANKKVEEGPSADAQSAVESSFPSLSSSRHSAAGVLPTNTANQSIIEIANEPRETAAEGAQTPTTHTISSAGFECDSDSDTFASVSAGPVSRAASRSRSEVSGIEVLDIAEDSDVDMLSEEGDGMATPDSWTEVGSGDESETEHEQVIGSWR